MSLLIIGLALFLGIHFVRILAPEWRLARIESMGPGPWKGLYSVVSVVGLILTIYGYSLAREDAGQAFVPIESARHLTYVIMPIALGVITLSDLPAGYIKAKIRHPMSIAVVLWSGVHLAANGDWASVALFGGFFIWSLILVVSAFRRPIAPIEPVGVWPDIAAIFIGLGLTLLFVLWAHEWLFGVSPL